MWHPRVCQKLEEWRRSWRSPHGTFQGEGILKSTLDQCLLEHYFSYRERIAFQFLHSGLYLPSPYLLIPFAPSESHHPSPTHLGYLQFRFLAQVLPPWMSSFSPSLVLKTHIKCHPLWGAFPGHPVEAHIFVPWMPTTPTVWYSFENWHILSCAVSLIFRWVLSFLKGCYLELLHSSWV